MCGIAGLVGSARDMDVPRVAGNLLRDLAHRGPDDRGWLAWNRQGARSGRGPVDAGDWEAVLLHRRLSILDLSPGGWQPMGTADGRYHITFNGEVYNFQEIRRELESLGHEFRSTSDTEVLLAAYARWGRQCLGRLVGMFAFAVLDRRERALFLARDFFGIKPLYYVAAGGYFAFASEIRSLLGLPGVGRGVNPACLHDYLRDSLVDHDGATLFASVRQLPAAHFLEVSLDRPHDVPDPVRYWEIDLDQRADLSFDEAARELRERFLDNVRLHLRSDVPVGAALSGGIDSSAIVLAMRHLQGPSLDIHTFSYTADDPAIDEERWIDCAGKAAGATIHKIRPGPGELADYVDELIRIQDVPFGGTSIYAQHRVFQLAREAGIKVMLDGQGADELFAGYRPYLSARVGSLFRRGRWWAGLAMLRRSSRLPGVGMRGTLRQIQSLPQLATVRGYAKRVLRGKAGQSWLNDDWFRQRRALGDAPAAYDGRDVLRHELHGTLMRTSLPQLLRYEDRNSMAFSIESRVPFLTPGLAQFVLSLPEEYFIAPDGTSKWVFREAMRGIVPDVILDRKDKIGFATPERQWLQVLQPWVTGVLDSETAREIGALDYPTVRRQWQAICDRRRPMDARVWRWINLVQWARRYEVSFN